MNEVLNIVFLVAAGQGIILGLVLLRAPYFRSSSNQYLAYTIILLSIIYVSGWISGIEELSSMEKRPVINMLVNDIEWTFLLPVVLWKYFALSIDYPFASDKRHLFFFLPFCLSVLMNILIDLDVNFHVYKLPVVEENKWDWIYQLYAVESICAHIFFLGMMVWSGYLLRKAPQTEKLAWLRRLWYFSVALTLMWIIFEAWDLASEGLYGWIFNILWMGISLYIYWLSYTGLFRFKLLEEQTEISGLLAKKLPKDQPAKTDASPPRLSHQSYIQTLEDLLSQEQLYRDPSLSREKVAERLGISVGYLSEVINGSTNKNFSEYINAFRVQAVKDMLTDPQLQKYTLLAIGLEAGFHSKSAFYAAFKKETGLTPGAYKSSLNKS